MEPTMTTMELIQLNIEDSTADGRSVGLAPVLAAVLDDMPGLVLNATILGGGFPQGPNAGPLGHAIEDNGTQADVALSEVQRWLSEGELIDDIHLWDETIALGRFDSGAPYVIGPKETIDRLRSSFDSVTESAPAESLLAPNGWQ